MAGHASGGRPWRSRGRGRLRLFTVPATLARTGRRVLLHLAQRAPWAPRHHHTSTTRSAPPQRRPPDRCKDPGYASLSVYEGQATWILLRSPFATGADSFAAASTADLDKFIVSSATIASVQIGAIAAGHILAVLIAPHRAVEVFDVHGGVTLRLLAARA